MYEEAVCGCGQVFTLRVPGSGSDASECWDCGRAAREAAQQLAAQQAADPLICRGCGTRMLVAVESRLCGLCDPEWIPVAP